MRPIGDRLNFRALLSGRSAEPSVDRELAFSDEEYQSLISRSRDIDVPESIMDYIYNLRTLIVRQAQENDSDEHEVPYVSDRRWKKILGIMRMSALLNGRNQVDYSDCLLMEHMIWDHDSQISKVGKDICEELAKTIVKDSMTCSDPRRQTSPSSRRGQEEFFSSDGVHYIIEAGGESIRIRISDYEKLTPEAVPGRFVGNDLVDLAGASVGSFLIKSPRSGAVAINNYVYRLRKKNAVAVSCADASMSSSAVVGAGLMLAEFRRQVEDNVFLADIEHYSLMTKTLQKYNGGR